MGVLNYNQPSEPPAEAEERKRGFGLLCIEFTNFPINFNWIVLGHQNESVVQIFCGIAARFNSFISVGFCGSFVSRGSCKYHS